MNRKLGKFAQDIFELRYAYPGEKTWHERAKVISRTAASAEKDDEKEKVFTQFYDAIGSMDFVPGGRIIFGSGRNSGGGGHNLLNCFVLIPEDNVESISKVLQDTYRISCAGGGIGFNASKIRPRGDGIAHIPFSSPGAVSFFRMINALGDEIRAGSQRRVALMGILNIDHPDILEFLTVKLDEKQLNNFNISVAITNKFIEACKKDQNWHFTFGNKQYNLFAFNRVDSQGNRIEVLVPALSLEDAEGRAKAYYKKDFTDTFEFIEVRNLKAKELWERIWSNAVKSGDPGIYNIDLANSWTNVNYFEQLNSTNPCGEISLPNEGNCCLGNVNLSNMVENGEFDWKRFARTVRAGVRFLDNILTINKFPTDGCKVTGLRSRRIGLGVMGYHYMLIKLGIRYGSEKCLEFTERLAETFRNEAYKMSTYLARDKSPFPAFNPEEYLKQEFAKSLPPRIRSNIRKYGIRNAVMLTIPPTGTISILAEISSGIEPIFAPLYNRSYRQDNVITKRPVVDPMLMEYYKGGKSIEGFVGAYDISPEEHMAVQAAWQKYIDSCISKTINLPADADWREFSDIALEYTQYLKGMTVYRAGSKGWEPLEAVPTTLENIQRFIKEVDLSEEVQSNDACSLSGGNCGG